MKAHFMYSLLGTYKKFEETAITQAHILESQTQTDFEEMQLIERSKLARIKDFSNARSSSNNWGYISSVANNITSLIPLVTGCALSLDKETKLPGYLLLGAGIANLANKILPDLGVYNKIASWMTSSSEMQETIASRLETGIQYASFVAAAAGGYIASATGGVAAQLTSWTTGGTNLAAQGIHLGKSFTDKQSADIRSDVQKNESRIQQLFQGIHQTTKESERLTHTIADICEALKSAIQSLYTRV